MAGPSTATQGCLIIQEALKKWKSLLDERETSSGANPPVSDLKFVPWVSKVPKKKYKYKISILNIICEVCDGTATPDCRNKAVLTLSTSSPQSLGTAVA